MKEEAGRNIIRQEETLDYKADVTMSLSNNYSLQNKDCLLEDCQDKWPGDATGLGKQHPRGSGLNTKVDPEKM